MIWVKGQYERGETIMVERKVHVEKVEELWVNIYGLGVLQEPSEIRQIRLLVLWWEIT